MPFALKGWQPSTAADRHACDRQPLTRWHGSRRGMAMVEFTLVAIPLMLAGLATLEIIQWQLTRTALGHALLEAARGGQDGWQQPERVQQRFEQALLPLWGADHTAASQHAALSRLHTAAASFQATAASPMWHIEPMAVSVPNGAKQSLALQLTYWQRPWVPGMSALLRQLGQIPPDSSLRSTMRRTGWLPIRQRIALEWHVRDPDSTHLPGILSPVMPSLTSAATLSTPLSIPPGSLFTMPQPPAGGDTTITPPTLNDEQVTPEQLCANVLCCS